jgi:hypothetical protein
VKDKQRQRTHGANRLSRRSLHSLLTRRVTLPQRGQAVTLAAAAPRGALSAVGTESGAEAWGFTMTATMRPWRRGVGAAPHRLRAAVPHERHAGPWQPVAGAAAPCGYTRDGRHAVPKAMRTRSYQHLQEDGRPMGGHSFVRGGCGGADGATLNHGEPGARTGLFGLAASMPSRTTSG